MLLFVMLALMIDCTQPGLKPSKGFQKTTQCCYILVMFLIFLFMTFFHPSEDRAADMVENTVQCFTQERENKRQLTATV